MSSIEMEFAAPKRLTIYGYGELCVSSIDSDCHSERMLGRLGEESALSM